MKTRCFNPNVIEYKNYGGRGIDVCDKWLNFKGFYDDMHETYTAHVNACGEENTTLERIENNLGYSPDNCIWASIKEQNNNSRNNRIIEFRGRIMNLSEAAKEFGIRVDTLHFRLKKGWSIGDALLKPVQQHRKVAK